MAKQRFGNIWLAKSGFGGTEYLLPALVSEGRKRGLSLNRMAELTTLNPARRFGLPSKGDIAPGPMPTSCWSTRTAASWSAPRLGIHAGLHALRRHRADRHGHSTFLRGRLIYDDGKVIGAPSGKYLKRPC